jgi:hypothetical protein
MDKQSQIFSPVVIDFSDYITGHSGWLICEKGVSGDCLNNEKIPTHIPILIAIQL